MTEGIDYTFESLKSILSQANSHRRIEKLTDRIFMVDIKAAEEQALILMKMKSIPNQVAWVWEEYAEEYVRRKDYRKAFEYYWYALDIYLLKLPTPIRCVEP